MNRWTKADEQWIRRGILLNERIINGREEDNGMEGEKTDDRNTYGMDAQ